MLAIYLLVVLRITQWPTLADPSALVRLERALAWWHARGLPEVVDVAVLEAAANVAMFVPMGVLVPVVAGWRRGRAWWAVPVGAVFSTTIELSQLAFFPERVATAADVATNTGGAAVGVGLLLAVSARRASPEGRDDRADPRTGRDDRAEPAARAPLGSPE